MCLAIRSNCDESINQLDCHCDQSINQFKFKSRVLGWSYFSKKEGKKISYCICKWKWPFRFSNKTKWTNVKMSRTIGPIVPSGIQPFHCFKILLDKKKLWVTWRYFSKLREPFTVNLLQIIFSSCHCTNHLMVGAVSRPLVVWLGSGGRPAPKSAIS